MRSKEHSNKLHKKVIEKQVVDGYKNISTLCKSLQVHMNASVRNGRNMVSCINPPIADHP